VAHISVSKIREISLTDVPVLLQIEQEQLFPWTKQLLQDCLQPSYQNWVLLQHNKIIGFVISKIILDECELLNIAITAAQRRKGHGQMLLQHVIDHAITKYVRKIFLEVRSSNQSAIALYKKMGFIKINERKNYYPAKEGREDAVIMIKEISPLVAYL
jgi:[ribosomal protein S18]-alanine N-acetyltransferase